MTTYSKRFAYTILTIAFSCFLFANNFNGVYKITSTAEDKPLIILDVPEVVVKEVAVENNIPTANISIPEFYPADMEIGIIGVGENKKLDHPKDNIFHIHLAKALKENDRVWLSYDLYGVEDHTSISRSINARRAIGGWFVNKEESWSAQRERLHPNWLTEGDNSIQFSIPEGAEHFYKVKNLGLVVERSLEAESAKREINITTSKWIQYANKVYVKGLVLGQESEEAEVMINGVKATTTNGAFELVFENALSSNLSDRKIEVKALFPDNEILAFQQALEIGTTPDYSFSFDTEYRSIEKRFVEGQEGEIRLEGAAITFDKSSLKQNKTFSLSALRPIDVAPLNLGIINVTKDYKAYRLSPNHIFEQGVNIHLAYDAQKIPAGYTVEDIQTFYFDRRLGEWKTLNRVKIDFGKSEIVSQGNQSTDYINGIVQVPESPETAAYTPTSIKDLKAADPSAAINLMPAPTANNMGTANISYPIIIPAGRQGMQPQIALNYNSGGGNDSWLGMGWNMSVPTLSLDTRWGVPRYSDVLETEIYMLNGQQLTFFEGEESIEGYLPNRSELVNRNTSGQRRFYPRVEGAFQKIVRHGTSPMDYWWEVTDKMGVVYSYGGTFEGGVEPSAVLVDQDGNIGHWALVEMRDLNGNFVSYQHSIVEDAGVKESTVMGKQLYCEQINYTGHEEEEGRYSVVFTRDRELQEVPRLDITINGRLGFKQVTADLLRKIEVQYDGVNIRSYELKYTRGAFQKTLLDSLIEYDALGERFVAHGMSYYRDVMKGGEYDPYGEIEEWSVGDDDVKGDIVLPVFNKETSVINGNESNNIGGGVALTVGGLEGNLISKIRTIGGNFSYSSSEGKGLTSLLDVDGDGLVDKVFKDGDKLYYRPNISTHENNETEFGEVMSVEGADEFSKSKTSSKSFGVEAHPENSIRVSYTRSKSKTTTNTYFQDFNGDGLIDIGKNGQVHFNSIDTSTNTPVFTVESNETPSPVYASLGIDENIVEIPEGEADSIINENPLHDLVRVWIAPYGGVVSISGAISIDQSSDFQAYENKDGIRATIQYETQELWRDSIVSPTFEDIVPSSDAQSVSINKGDRIFFRLQSIMDGVVDLVNWDPIIIYESQDLDEKEANGKKINQFQASEDFILTSPQTIIVPYEGKINIEGALIKPICSDDITINIIHRGAGMETKIFERKVTWDVDTITVIDIMDFGVLAEDEIEFKINASTNIDWSAIAFKPRLYYTEAVDKDNNEATVIVSDTIKLSPLEIKKDTIIDFYPAVEYEMYNNILKQASPNSVPINTTLTITSPAINFSTLSGNFTLSVKAENKLLGKDEVTINNGIAIATVNFSVMAGEEYFIEYHTDSLDIANLLLANVQAEAGVYTTIEEEHTKYGPLYRGWGQFIYNGNRSRAFSEINVSELEFQKATGNKPIADLKEPTELNGEFDPMKSYFMPLIVDQQKSAWVGCDPMTFLKADTVSSSRLGEDNIDPSISSGGMNPTQGSSQIPAPNKVNKSTTNSLSGNAGVSGSWSSTTTVTMLDAIDFNGDRYPDIVSNKNIQYTNMRGGLSDEINGHELGSHESKSQAIGVSYGGSPTIAKTDNSQEPMRGVPSKSTSASTNSHASNINSTIARETSSASLNLSGNLSCNSDNVNHSWMDVNGDGLPDKVMDNGNVALNIGYSFLEEEDWDFENIREGTSSDIGGGVGVSLYNGSIQAGIGASLTSNGAVQALQDVNGDGLVDIVSLDCIGLDVLENSILNLDFGAGGFLSQLENCLEQGLLNLDCDATVKINTGNGFEDAVTWSGYKAIDEGSSTGESINAGFTVCIPIIIAGIRICVNPSVNAGHGVSRQKNQLIDVDGDGFPDYITSDNDGQLTVRKSTIAKTNKLKDISRPLGSSISLDYQPVGNTYNHPHSVWTLSEVTIRDGFEGDGADSLITQYVYEDGYYDRHEREFYGFGKILSKELDTEDNNTVYRTGIQVFNNQNYYEKGLLASEMLVDGSGNPFTETRYDYKLKNVHNGGFIDDSMADKDNMAAFPAMIDMHKYFYEGQANAMKATRMMMGHDRFGNIVKYEDFGDTTADMADITENDNYISEISYHNESTKYIVGIPSQIIVKDKAEKIYRKRTTAIDENNGNLLKVSRFLENGDGGHYDMSYDTYGNIIEIIRPENHKGERLTFSYEFDDEVNIFVTRIEDSFGHISTSTFDVRFGQELNSFDLNQQEIRREIDAVGRITKITGPYEIAAGVDGTIHFDFHPEAEVPWALTQHYDPQHPDNFIETVTFTDGLSRVLQVKKDGDIFVGAGDDDMEMRIVSGRVKFDAFGRTVSTRYPVLEELSIEKGLFNEIGDTVAPTTTSFDVLDRTTLVTLPDGAETKTSFDFGEDRDGQVQFLTKVTDPNEKKKDQFTNVRGLVTATYDYIDDAPEHGNIWTSFAFNPINELIQVKDDQDNLTLSEFDNYGRRILRNHPDHGICTYTFDQADNLIAKQTANIKAEDESMAIRYEYEFERLLEIRYPINPSNNVRYRYGDPESEDDVTFNRLGRVVLQADATGSQIFFYDRLGEVNKVNRTVNVIQGRPGRTFTSRWKYDTWNRITRMVYPDGEILDYHYNRGGKLRSMDSEKLEVPYQYLAQLGYDKFEQKVYSGYGNGTETSYAYEEDRRRLEHLVTKTAGSPRPIMDNQYTYDKTINIERIKNNAWIPYRGMGGPSEYTFQYDDLYRLVGAEGHWGNYTQVQRYGLRMTYNSLHDIVEKRQIHQRVVGDQYIDPDILFPNAVIDWQAITSPIPNQDWTRGSNFTTHRLPYSYTSDKPHAATEIGPYEYRYDANGNMSSREDIFFFGRSRKLEWDEEDRLMVLDDDELVHQYVYDADNVRVVKRKNIGNFVYVNGQLVIGDESDGDYTVYVNPYIVVDDRGYTKHIFIEGQRICTKIGLGGNYGLGTNWGDWENWREWDPFDNWAINEDWENWYNNGNWAAEDGLWNDFQNVEESFQYFFHSDHLGNTGYITDVDGEVHQHLEYLPFGELFVQEHLNFDRTPYLFNGKELDEETQLYYYGSRYYDPQISRWLSVDPMAEKYQGWSPYNYGLNNPIIYIDPVGEDVLVVVWPTEKDKVGHAGIAIQKPGTKRFVYRDLWPGSEVDETNYDKDVPAKYEKKEHTLDEIMSTDVTGSEGYAPLGVIRLKTDKKTDEKVSKVLDDFEKRRRSYNGLNCNCSDYVESGIQAVAKEFEALEKLSPSKRATTPNELFRQVKELPNARVIKDPGEKVNRGFVEGITGSKIKGKYARKKGEK